ncbi:ABC transporter permease [Cytophagaceae bacterium DM2B3-1]|uniref:ABC transporter permease n=1 Tax=Xanthocytophaga flava TaxID=3048013 RepID=A0ABT7CFM8_9BACT|nr:ABC transporter permease [Xanthocytophaga flavus]MDJ1491795.1 ABC transporter permease [Xanthocytophaga flavus]
MLRNYFKIAFRNLQKNKAFSFINILGLSVGMACCMLILLYVQNEISYDKHHTRAEDMYRVGTTFVTTDQTKNMPYTPAPMAFTLKADFPEVEQATRVFVPFNEDKAIFKLAENGKVSKSFYESKGYMADSTFFDLFSYKFIEGVPHTALNEPNSVVVSEEIAQKLFGNQSALNKIVHIASSNGNIDFKITGVFRPDKLSTIDGRFFMSLSSGEMGAYVRSARNFAFNNMFYTFIRLQPGSNPQALEKKLTAFINKYAGADMKAAGFKKKQFLEAVSDLHLKSEDNGQMAGKGSISYVYLLTSIAIFTLLIACINFMNLSTARSGKRAAEVGIRKVVGAEKAMLISQFLGESLLLSILGLVIASVLVFLFLPVFNQLASTSIHIEVSQHVFTFFGFIALAIVTGLIAGSYPAFYLASFQPIKVLKGKFTNTLAAVNLRRGLVIFQFSISIILILASLVVWKQMNYLKDQSLGFKQAQQVVIPLRTKTTKSSYEALKTEIQKNSQVVSAAAAGSYPGIFSARDQNFYTDGKTGAESVNVKLNDVDYNFIETLGFKVISGRPFSKNFAADTNSRIVLNEKAVAAFGYTPENVIGKRLHFDWNNEVFDYEIIGVVKDFHYEGLQQSIGRFGFLLDRNQNYNYMVVNVNTSSMESMLQFMETQWKKFNPEEPFEYTFMDQDFQRNYDTEQRMGTIVSYFTFIAIFISCLGLYGLATFTAEQRIKEIGIRKVLGASITNIVQLLSKDFLKLVLIALLIAGPIAWYAMNEWLQKFAYRIEIQWWMFAIAGCMALLIAFLTVSFQAVKAALINPVKSLKTE